MLESPGSVDEREDSVAEIREIIPEGDHQFTMGPYAEPGDTLAVKIENIEFTRDWAASCLVPFFGGLTSTNLTATLQEPLPEKVWKCQIGPVADSGVFRRGVRGSARSRPRPRR